jgi:hypothetical protein
MPLTQHASDGPRLYETWKEILFLQRTLGHNGHDWALNSKSKSLSQQEKQRNCHYDLQPMEITSNRVSKLPGRAIEKICTEHAQHIRLHQAEKSEMGGNSIEADRRTLTRVTD